MTFSRTKPVKDALKVLRAIQMPRAQLNERSALCLLALLDLSPGKTWSSASNPLIGITPIMDWIRQHYRKDYAPNTRETVRRQTMHQFVQAGLALYNPDLPHRPVNSPKAVYQVEPTALLLFRSFGTEDWEPNLEQHLATRGSLVMQYARERRQEQVPVQIEDGKQIRLSPGAHSELIRAIVESFAPRFVPGGLLVYVGDTGEKWGYFNEPVMRSLGLLLDPHGKMPDVVLLDPVRNWLLLVEAVTSHGPVDKQAAHGIGRAICPLLGRTGLC